eukprot:c13913_g1_i4.p1 GENE.c13913_g1_i4~~c13913_g1_i4.p1  ORF type:complete len:283 (+),score=51.35 c13913_g1_i4:292-1140(+)
MWVLGSVCGIIAVNRCGLGLSQAIWSAAATITSFLWGFLAQPLWDSQRCALKDPTLAGVGIALQVVFVMLLVCITTPTGMPQGYRMRSLRFSKKMETTGETEALQTPTSTSTTSPQFGTPAANLQGALFALACGIVFGTGLVPNKFAPHHASGISFMLPFSCGGFAGSCVVYLIARVGSRSPSALAFHLRTAWLPCICSGVLLSIANACSFLVTQSSLGLTIGYPLMQQGSIVISGLVGVFFLREVTRPIHIFIFFICVAGIGGGAFILAEDGACQHPSSSS